MTHPWTDRLSEYVDDGLTAAARRDLETHLATCHECRTTVQELREVVNRAASLADVRPSSDLWPGIAERLESRRPFLLRRGILNCSGSRWDVTLSIPQLAAAAVLLIAISAVSMWWLQPRRAPREIVEVDPSRTTTRVAATPTDLADAPYDAAIADLQRVLKEGRDQLDPATVEVLERNLAIIDQAIRDARAALAQDPSDLYLSGHLVAARKRKLELLRQASALIVEGT